MHLTQYEEPAPRCRTHSSFATCSLAHAHSTKDIYVMPSATDARYAFTFKGGVTTKEEALATLDNDGPLCVAKEHMAVLIAPGAFALDTESGLHVVHLSRGCTWCI